MKREHLLLLRITLAAIVVLAGVVPASAQTAAEPEKSPATATPAQPTSAETPEKSDLTPAQKRLEIDRMAKATQELLMVKSTDAKKLYEKAYGYAVFDNWKLAFLVTGSGGNGVAIAKAFPAERTYMNMGSAGVGASLGAHKYQVVFLFETKERFNSFVNEGWTADVSANAVAGEAGANAQAGFKNGIAIYQFTDGGLMINADVAGTKYWRDDELNMKEERTD